MALGGRGTLVGAVLGALLVNFAKTYLTGAFAESWLFVLGGMFVVTTVFLPRGVLGLAAQLLGRLAASRAVRDPAAPIPDSSQVESHG